MPLAARIGDMHTCPVNDGPKPHVGGPVITGAGTVTIGYMPAARVGDMCTCVGGPDSIAAGSASVTVEYMSAARQGDTTAHGGMISMGCATVLIGDSSSVAAASSESSPPADPAPAEESFQNASDDGTPLVGNGPCEACQGL